MWNRFGVKKLYNIQKPHSICKIVNDHYKSMFIYKRITGKMYSYTNLFFPEKHHPPQEPEIFYNLHYLKSIS